MVRGTIKGLILRQPNLGKGLAGILLNLAKGHRRGIIGFLHMAKAVICSLSREKRYPRGIKKEERLDAG